MNTLEDSTKSNLLISADLYRLLSRSFAYPDDEAVGTIRNMIGELMQGKKVKKQDPNY